MYKLIISALVIQGWISAQTIQQASVPTQAITNSGSGTTNTLLAKLNSSGQAITATTADTAIPVLLVVDGAGTSGFAKVAYPGGLAQCHLDASGAVAYHFLGASTLTAGRCADLGATIPAGCWIGFASVAGSANATINVVIQPGCNAATAGGTINFQVGGSSIGSPPSIFNFTVGAGVLLISSNPGGVNTLQVSADTAYLTTIATQQSGSHNFVTEGVGSTATIYVGTMSPTLTAYTTGMVVIWKVVTSCTGGTATTINVDTLGAKGVKQFDGTTDPTSGNCLAGRILQLGYDGTLFRIMAGGN